MVLRNGVICAMFCQHFEPLLCGYFVSTTVSINSASNSDLKCCEVNTLVITDALGKLWENLTHLVNVVIKVHITRSGAFCASNDMTASPAVNFEIYLVGWMYAVVHTTVLVHVLVLSSVDLELKCVCSKWIKMYDH